MSINYDLGIKGEEIAQQHIINKGYTILETNWHYRNKEIDIIAIDKKTLVILEVKTRTYGENLPKLPEESVGKAKQKNLIEAANAYVEMKEIELEVRFDIISVTFFSEIKQKIEHIEDAFTPRW
jgi:putative endonuclease